MNLESQLVSLELAKRLKELDVKQDSIFYWHAIDTPYPSIVTANYKLEKSDDFLISAFTVAELAEMLPHNIEGCPLVIDKPFKNHWSITYRPEVWKGIGNLIVKEHFLLKGDEKLVDAFAKMLIYLLDNGLMKNE